MKSNYVSRAIKFLDSILPYIQNDLTDVMRVKTIVERYNYVHKRKVLVRSGATRCVLITSDYVIKWDYGRNIKVFGGCIDEAENYEIACQDGFEYLLAETTSIMRFGRSFNIMPRYKISDDIEKEEGKPWIYDMITYEEREWLYNHIGDIHEMNYVVVHGRPIIIDYACRPFHPWSTGRTSCESSSFR